MANNEKSKPNENVHILSLSHDGISIFVKSMKAATLKSAFDRWSSNMSETGLIGNSFFPQVFGETQPDDEVAPTT